MQNLLLDLNSQQYSAVTLSNEESTLVLAGAGSGKTRVLITRIAWLIQNDYASSETILCVTFTNKAAREMLHRLSNLLLIDTCEMWIGTFHGLCNRMLRVHYNDAYLSKSFQILDTADQLSAIKRLMNFMNIDSERFPLKKVQYFINNAKEHGFRKDNIDITDNFNRKLVEIYHAYEDQCQKEGVVDFPELILRCNELLSRNSIVRTHYQVRFKHILVDEFQDTNKLQYTWLKMLSSKKNTIFAVGDDDQSIYAFRGADVGNMRNFEKEFQIRNIIKLEQNYRSNGNILNAANYLISHNSNRFRKNLSTNSENGELVIVYQAETDSQEAKWVTKEILSLVKTSKISYKEIAVLYRSNAQSRSIEYALRNAGISYQVYGGLRFFERQEVKYVLSYLLLIDNPRNDTAFLRVVNFPVRGIGQRSIEQLKAVARRYNSTMIEAIPYISGKVGANFSAFSNLIEKMRSDTLKMNLPETIEYVIRESGLKKFYESAEQEGKERLENLKELVNAATVFLFEKGNRIDEIARSSFLHQEVNSYRKTIPSSSNYGLSLDQVQYIDTTTMLSGFLSLVSLEITDGQENIERNDVQLMTVHSAKGLEFSAVFITGLEEKLFPHENSLIKENGLEEERRLMYVAITRAKKRLYLSSSKSRILQGQMRYNIRSRFFCELPQKIMKCVRPDIENNYYFNQSVNMRLICKQKKGISNSLFEHKKYSDCDSIIRLRIGQTVFHKKFGEGIVINLDGDGIDAKAKVKFNLFGERWLSIALANLKISNKS